MLQAMEVRGGEERSACEQGKDKDSGVWNKSGPLEEIWKGTSLPSVLQVWVETHSSVVAACCGRIRNAVLQSSRKRRITRIGTHIFSLESMIFARWEFCLRMFLVCTR